MSHDHHVKRNNFIFCFVGIDFSSRLKNYIKEYRHVVGGHIKDNMA